MKKLILKFQKLPENVKITFWVFSIAVWIVFWRKVADYFDISLFRYKYICIYICMIKSKH